MAKKQQGSATIERGRLAGEGDAPLITSRGIDMVRVADLMQGEQTTVPIAADGPVKSHSDLMDRGATYTPETVAALKSRFPFNGVYPGSSLNIKLKLSPKESDTMRKLYLALNESNTRLANGRHIGSIADVVTWVMEDATRQIEERAGA